MSWLIVALRQHEQVTYRPFASHEIVTDPTKRNLSDLRTRLSDGSVLSAAVVADQPGDDTVWRAFEWPGCVYVDRGCESQLVVLLADGWYVSASTERYVILAPHDDHPTDPLESIDDGLRHVDRDEFGAMIRSSTPLQTTVTMHDHLIDDEGLFGDFVPNRLGGSTALLMLSDMRRSGEVVLRNPAALELDLLDSETTSLAAHARVGTVTCVAAGLTSSSQPTDWDGFADPAAMRNAWASTNRSQHRYFVAIELAAPLVDPPVWIPAGQVFQQRTVIGFQTLAVSQTMNMTVSPGKAAHVIASAWCLNQALAEPSGQLMQSTPFRVRYPEGHDQGRVWEHRNRLMAGVQ